MTLVRRCCVSSDHRYQYRLLAFVSIAFCLGSATTGATAQGATGLLTEQTAVEQALADNPSLMAMQLRYEALLAVPSQVGALPDPMLNLNAMNFPTDSWDRDQEAMTQLQVGISQVFPFPGKRGLHEEAAAFDAMAAGHSVDEMRIQLVQNVKARWWQVYYLDRALDTLNKNQTLLRQFIAVAKTKYETGKGLQQDILLAQLELSRLMDQGIQLEALRQHQAIALNTLLDRPAAERFDIPVKVPLSMPALRDEMALYEAAEMYRPTLKQRATHIEAARSRLELAEKDRYPDLRLGVVYGARDGDNPASVGGSRADLFSVMLGAQIPLYSGSKQSKAVSQRTTELARSRYQLIDEKGAVRAAISASVTDYRRSRRQFELFATGIIPQAQLTVQSMLAAYQVSEVDFLNLLRSQMTLFNYELQYWKALSEARQALARLEAAVGQGDLYE
ncbi:TolC family protein [Halieaceae bacterium IMCC14734]|uniref:TolC family protein n=2 Tax=Candidatus Litorirhabdus singularis TaxID=2518993 RepID=A0ABT3TBQ6_9GAMM|nr:TolC family protein [Candidatus Litorirhabdus singularis]